MHHVTVSHRRKQTGHSLKQQRCCRNITIFYVSTKPSNLGNPKAFDLGQKQSKLICEERTEVMTQRWNGGCLGEDHWTVLLQTVLRCLRSQHKYNPQHRVISTETNLTVFILRRMKAKTRCSMSLSKDFPSVKDFIKTTATQPPLPTRG